MHNVALSIARQFYEDSHEPTKYWPKQYREKASYEKWAANEIVRLLEQDQSNNSALTVSAFMKRIKKYATFNPKAYTMFMYAYSVAENVLDTIKAAM